MQHAAPTTAYRTAARAPGVRAEPLDRVMGMGRDATLVLAIMFGVATAFHAGAFLRAWLIPVELLEWDRRVSEHVGDKLNETYEIEQEKAKPADPPPPPPPPDPVPEKADAPPPTTAQEAAPPAAAQAGAVLTAPADPNDVEDLTGAFVSGNADNFAGGVTQAGGTSKDAVYNRNARTGGVPGGTGKTPGATAQAVGADRSRGIQLSGGAEWHCPFPAEADQDQIDDAYATVSVSIGADGRVASVSVVQDPGHGFGREARACAQRETFLAALDHDGNPLAATKSFRIHFER